MLASTSGNMSNNGSYGNDRPGSSVEPDYNIDPASGSFFHLDYKKHDDLKEMLDSNKDSLKLEAMKRIIGMVAKGRDASELFPAVVKNVVSKNIEVKKLVYVYLVRYAEEQQDLVLLSISTFQRALKEPNQLIRASALRVLSSIRVTMIVPIVMLAIRDAAADMSPYVRKTAAHAIPKLYSLDAEQKPELVSIIERLLADRTTLVVGSAVMAFTEVCPERSDLIHKVYRKLCTLLVDVDEWGQIVIINMLTRYARTQFADPNLHTEDPSSKSDYESWSDSEKMTSPSLDPDHRLLLRSVRPLLQSRNAAVVMAVAQLYHHCAPISEGHLAAKALVRLLRSHSEVQSIVLDSIASISLQKKKMFEPYLKSFYVRTSDLTRIKLLKLEILTNLATEVNIPMILRELRTYLCSSDKQFVASTIQAIGRCACSISDVTDSCLNGLVSLLSSKDEAIVAESVIVIKRLLQTRATDPHEIVTHMAKLLDSITVAQARAAILWLLGEYSQGVTYIAPDVLRKIAKTFTQEHDIVKLQALNLAVKLYITNSEQTKLLCQYMFNLARYDQNYDIRDRARLLKYFCQTQDKKDGHFLLTEYSEKIFLAPKPAPMLQSRFKDRIHLQLGSLSHYINVRANGYQPLPTFPSNPPSGVERNVDSSSERTPNTEHSKQDGKDIFFWKSTSSSEAESSSSEETSSASEAEEESEENEDTSDYGKNFEEDKDDEEGDDEKSETDEEESDDETEESSEESEETNHAKTNNKPNNILIDSNKNKPSTDKNNSNNTDSSKINKNIKISVKKSKEKVEKVNSTNNSSNDLTKNEKDNENKTTAKSNLDLLLDLESDVQSTITPVLTPSLGGFLTPTEASTEVVHSVPPCFIPNKSINLLDRINGRGLSVTYRYTRSPHLFSSHMVNIGLTFTNSNQQDITEIKVGKKTLPPGMLVHDFACIASLPPLCSLPGTLGIDFNDSTQPANIEIVSSVGTSLISIKPKMGELIKPIALSEDAFQNEQSKLRGMNEHSISIQLDKQQNIVQSVLQVANLNVILSSTENIYRFVGETLTSGSKVLVSVISQPSESKINVIVNCEKIVVGSMLISEFKASFS